MIPKIQDTNITISKGGRAFRDNSNTGFKPKFSTLNDSNKTKKIIEILPVLKMYKMKGFEFGNWLSNNDRYDYLIATTQSLDNLSKIIKSKNIGFDSTLGIAFGARGVAHAVAHYEPCYKMINLTKTMGFGSLAHEYGHSIDFIIGTYIDQNKTHAPLSGGQSTLNTLKDNKGGALRTLMNEMIDKIKIFKKERKVSENEYYKRRTEIFARLFEQYISYELKERKIKDFFIAERFSDYCNCKNYITSSEFAQIYPKMQKFITELGKQMNKK